MPGRRSTAMASVHEVAGRFTVRTFGDVRARLMLAKNPAGWNELLDLVAGSETPLVVSINARVADGADPSWLWDVPFERLAGRTVVATGDRFRDLSVRLHYAGRGACHRGRSHCRVRRAARWLMPTRWRCRSDADAGGWSTSSATTRLSTICCRYAGMSDRAPRRGGVPRPARDLRRRRQRADPGPPSRVAGPRRSSCCRPPRIRPLPEADIYCLGGGEDGPQVRAAAHADRRRDARPPCGRRRGRAGGVRRVPGGRADLPRRRTAARTRASAFWTSTRSRGRARERWARCWPTRPGWTSCRR